MWCLYIKRTKLIVMVVQFSGNYGIFLEIASLLETSWKFVMWCFVKKNVIVEA